MTEVLLPGTYIRLLVLGVGTVRMVVRDLWPSGRFTYVAPGYTIEGIAALADEGSSWVREPCIEDDILAMVAAAALGK